MPVDHNGVNILRDGRAGWESTPRTYRGVTIPPRLDPADFSPRARYRMRAWCSRVDVRLAGDNPSGTKGLSHRP